MASTQGGCLSATDSLSADRATVRKRLVDGDVLPFVRAGAGAVGRPADGGRRVCNHVRRGAEVTACRVESYRSPEGRERELGRVRKHVEPMMSEKTLFREPHAILAKQLHHVLPELAQSSELKRIAACQGEKASGRTRRRV
jgi:hypothetical protein